VETYKQGDFIRWITGHGIYEAYDDGAVGVDPIYEYGIILEVSMVDKGAIIVHSFANKVARLLILNNTIDEIEVLSEGGAHG
tara:strand:- start:3325 stop:3570 length:246 start_codon:yes stop_codon:yes gene_type:complete